jgi:hypothetical protein
MDTRIINNNTKGIICDKDIIRDILDNVNSGKTEFTINGSKVKIVSDTYSEVREIVIEVQNAI